MKRIEAFKRAEKYIKEYRIKEREDIRLHREARKHNNFYVPAEPKLAFVVRIRGLVRYGYLFSDPFPSQRKLENIHPPPSPHSTSVERKIWYLTEPVMKCCNHRITCYDFLMKSSHALPTEARHSTLGFAKIATTPMLLNDLDKLFLCSINGVHPRPRKVMQLFRLRQINNGTFLKLNKATINMLRLCEPYVTWG